MTRLLAEPSEHYRVSLAPPGKTKGVRLIYLESLLAHLHRHSQGGNCAPRGD